MKQMTQQEAIDFAESGKWEELTHLERAQLQLNQELLCMPMGVFHEAVEKALGRPVWTHEFAKVQELREELNGQRDAPSFSEIVNKLNLSATKTKRS